MALTVLSLSGERLTDGSKAIGVSWILAIFSSLFGSPLAHTSSSSQMLQGLPLILLFPSVWLPFMEIATRFGIHLIERIFNSISKFTEVT